MRSSAATVRPIHILLVEDNPADVRLAQESLKEAKLLNQMTVVGDGDDALAYLREADSQGEAALPDLILLDMNLPRMDGLEVLDELQKDERLKRIPVVILTASKVEQRVLKTYHLPAECYITKPLEAERYLDAVRCFPQLGISIVLIATA